MARVKIEGGGKSRPVRLKRRRSVIPLRRGVFPAQEVRSAPPVKFIPSARLDPSQVQDLRGGGKNKLDWSAQIPTGTPLELLLGKGHRRPHNYGPKTRLRTPAEMKALANRGQERAGRRMTLTRKG